MLIENLLANNIKQCEMGKIYTINSFMADCSKEFSEMYLV